MGSTRSSGGLPPADRAHDLRVLVADDNELDRDLLTHLLARADPNASCELATCGEAALSAVSGQQYDLVLLDQCLSDAVGTALVPKVQALQPDPCAVIVIAGESTEHGAVEAMRAGAYDYIPKRELTVGTILQAIEGGRRWVRMERELKDAKLRLERLSLYDSLTGLPNRNLFFDRLHQALAARPQQRAPFALLMIDLDLFKEINDTYGHDVGDQVLTEIGRRLQACCREGDTFARLGGDEFAALILGAECAPSASVVAERVSSMIREPVVADGHVLGISCSIGIALAPVHGTHGHALMSRADQAMYAAKRGGTDYVLCGLCGHSESRLIRVASRLPQAIDNAELSVYYQPKIELATGRVIGVEALARWWSPSLGWVEPAEFIPLAERTAAISSLTDYVIDQSLRQHCRWARRGCALPVSVNISTRASIQGRLAGHIAHLSATLSISSSVLTLEVSEPWLVASPEACLPALRELSAMGIHIALDDFGATYSSLRVVRELCPDEIKLDRSLLSHGLTDGRDRGIIRAAAALCEGMGASLVAVGLEHQGMISPLQALGCHAGQGFCFAPAIPADKVVPWCENHADALTARSA